MRGEFSVRRKDGKHADVQIEEHIGGRGPLWGRIGREEKAPRRAQRGSGVVRCGELGYMHAQLGVRARIVVHADGRRRCARRSRHEAHYGPQ